MRESDAGPPRVRPRQSLSGRLWLVATLAVLLSPQLPLSRRQHEMIATVVSAQNSCFY